MIYLDSFHFPSREEDEHFFIPYPGNPNFKTKNFRTIYQTKYPFTLFRERELPDRFEFRDITIFCGDNGSGKSTILNVISETLGLRRGTPYNRSDFFDDYTELCRYSVREPIPQQSRIITSDDVFSRVMNIRRLNAGIDDKRQEMIDEYIALRQDDADTALHGLDDYERWSKTHEARKKSGTQSEYLRARMVRSVEEHSNGESALAFFAEAIEDGGLYLLDEPENSLSPQHQLDLKYFLQDAVKNHACQFILSTHSPFLLSLMNARIYDIDSVPPVIRRYDDLECVKVYKDFFEGNI